MDVGAWCGWCGESFGLGELVNDGWDGRCPRCGEQLAANYTPVAAASAHQLLDATKALALAVEQLRDVAPRLHVDVRRLRADLETELGS